jgi:hypothetical protein
MTDDGTPEMGMPGVCGDGVLNPEELCDTDISTGPGSCPTSCDDGEACTTDALNGGGTCLAECVFTSVGCVNSDGCCPAACSAGNDNDCVGPATFCNLVYDLTPTFRVIGTPLMAGDATRTLPDGKLVLRVEASSGVPMNGGTIEVLFMYLDTEFSIMSSVGSANVVTDIASFSATCSGNANPAPAGDTMAPYDPPPSVCDYTDTTTTMATGTFTGTQATWNGCTRHANYGTNNYTTANSLTSTGSGCLRTWRSVGTVTCTGSSCSLGGLPNGMPTLSDSTATLPLETFTFTNGINNVSMPQIAIPNERSGRTTAEFTGARVPGDPNDTRN